jgi:hypothetical protein
LLRRPQAAVKANRRGLQAHHRDRDAGVSLAQIFLRHSAEVNIPGSELHEIEARRLKSAKRGTTLSM